MKWLLLQIQSWWLPYVFGTTASGMRFYQHWFSQTVLKVLPQIADHPIPDVGHMVLQGCILLALVISSVTFWKGRICKRAANLETHAA